ncbi:MAG: asparaginase [Rhodospirillales bacterium]|nr:asparaginase [Rhodospirillales bacterium]
MADPPANPTLVAVSRGERIESFHRGAAAVVGVDGALVAGWGDIERPVFIRSTAKPLQALALLESGAADAQGVSAAELAIACGSHGGAPAHVACVGDWLGRLGLGAGALVCGPHPPIDVAAARALIRAGRPETRLHNNCSGKHAGFLTVARHLNLPLAGYGDADHPLQELVRRTVGEMSDCEIGPRMIATDGCGVPVFALPVRALARAYARLAQPDGLAPDRAGALRRIAAAMSAHPVMVAGHGRFDTEIIAASAGAIIVKAGAEGVYAAAIPRLGLGVVLKIDDGAKRAAEAAMAALLLAFARPGDTVRQRLASFRDQPLFNTAHARVGAVRPYAEWPGG